MEEAAAICDRVAILCEGRIVAAASPAGLVAKSRARPRIEIRTARAMTAAEASDSGGLSPPAASTAPPAGSRPRTPAGR